MASTFVAMQDPLYLVLLAFVCFGMVCVFATFGFMMPVVGTVVSTVFGAVMGEQAGAKARGQTSGVELPPDHPSRR
jgi:hypothetical protein